MNEEKFSESDLRLAFSLSTAQTNLARHIILLKHDYGYSLTKSNLAEVLKKSEQTIDRRIKESSNIPEYIKSGNGKKSSYIFTVIDVAEYLSIKKIKIY
jgi:hypothetical protein